MKYQILSVDYYTVVVNADIDYKLELHPIDVEYIEDDILNNDARSGELEIITSHGFVTTNWVAVIDDVEYYLSEIGLDVEKFGIVRDDDLKLDLVAIEAETNSDFKKIDDELGKTLFGDNAWVVDWNHYEELNYDDDDDDDDGYDFFTHADIAYEIKFDK